MHLPTLTHALFGRPHLPIRPRLHRFLAQASYLLDQTHLSRIGQLHVSTSVFHHRQHRRNSAFDLRVRIQTTQYRFVTQCRQLHHDPPFRLRSSPNCTTHQFESHPPEGVEHDTRIAVRALLPAVLPADSFDHFGRLDEGRLGKFEAERFGGLEIEDEIESGRPFDRYVTGFFAFENLVHEMRRAAR